MKSWESSRRAGVSKQLTRRRKERNGREVEMNVLLRKERLRQNLVVDVKVKQRKVKRGYRGKEWKETGEKVVEIWD